MNSLFEDLKQGLEEAIEYEKGKGIAKEKTSTTVSHKEKSGPDILKSDEIEEKGI